MKHSFIHLAAALLLLSGTAAIAQVGAVKVNANTGALVWPSAATFRSANGLGIGVQVQAYDADLTTWAGITPSANGQSLVAAANYAAMKTLLGLNNVENTAVSAWTGSTNLTTLGTIATGTWNATAISTSKGGVPSGGTTGQVLRKASGTSYDVAWATPSGGAKLVNVSSPTARRGLTAAEVNVGDIVRTLASAAVQEAYDLTVDATLPNPGQVILDIGDGNVFYAVIDNVGTAPEGGSPVPVTLTSSMTPGDIASALATAISEGPFFFSGTVDGSDPLLVHIVSTFPIDRTDLSAFWPISQVSPFSPASYEKHLVIDTGNLTSDALGFAKFAND